MHSIRSLLALAALYLALSQGSAETVKDRAAAVRSDYAVMQSSLRWIYNDIDRAFAQARKTGKPLLVALRCIPCKSCMGLDVSILNSPDLNPLLDQFVCVRIINANALDLSKFQFDYDLSFSTLFFNGDGSVYGRFGSWQHQRDSNDTSLDSYKAALETALQIHKSYPANRSQLASRQGSPVRYQSPIEIPTLAGKYSRDLDWKGRVVDSCVHCHQIGDALREEHRARSNRMPLDLIYPMPGTAVAGFDLEPGRGFRVKEATPGGAAAAAGLRAGDTLTSVGEAPIVSAADIAWALHRLGDKGTLVLGGTRNGEAKTWTLELEDGWRFRSDISRRVGTWGLRGMVLGGLLLRSMPEDRLKALGLPEDSLGLEVEMAGEYGIHAASRKAGFRKGDILVSVEGLKGRMTESELIGRLLISHPGKGSLTTTVARGEARLSLQLPLQ